MPRMILSIMTATMVMCMVCLHPTQTSAKSLESLSRDFTDISDEYIILTCPLPITITCEDNQIYQSFAEFEAAGGSLIVPPNCDEDAIVLTHEGDELISQNGCELSYSRNYLLTLDCNNTFMCSQMVILTDTDNPVLANCPTDVLLTLSVGDVDCMVEYTVPMDVTATDGCSDAEVSISGAESGMYPVGTTTITYTASDDCGNTSTCSFDIVVSDTTPLDVTAPTDIVVSDASMCDASSISPYADISAFLAAMGTIESTCSTITNDNLTLTSSDLVTSTTCPFTLVRTYTVTDIVTGNSGSDTQTITVIDNTNPTFDIPADATVDCSDTQNITAEGGGSPTNVMDNCDSSPTVTWFDKDTIVGACAGDFTFTRSWIVTDNCMNADTMDQTITAIDTTAPEIICVGSFDFYLDDIGMVVFPADTLDNGTSDDCSAIIFSTDPINNFFGCNQLAAPIEINLIATDECGNSSSCNVNVTLLDTMSISLTAPPDITVNDFDDVPSPYTDIDQFIAHGGIVDDNCNILFPIIAGSADTTSICETIIVQSYQYIDLSGNTGTASQMITVLNGETPEDTSPPVITNVSNQFVALNPITCTFDTTFTLPMASDDIGLDTTYITIGPFVDNEAVITFTAEDLCGKVSDTTFILTVMDLSTPLLLIDDITIMCDSMNAAAPIYNTLAEFLTGPNASATDCNLDPSTFLHMQDDTLANGTIIRKYSIDDFMGNTATEEQEITFSDSTDPEFTSCPTNITQSTNPGACVGTINIPDPEFNDNCNGELTLTHNSPYSVIVDNADADYPIGTTEVSYFLVDEAGLSDTCTFTITVSDNEDPVITCPNDTLIVCSITNYPIVNSLADLILQGGSASDNCGIETFSADPDTLSPTSYTYTYTVVDSSGNMNSCTQNILIIDTLAPQFICGMDIEIDAPSDACEIQVNITPPTATDDCDSDLTITNSLTGAADPSGIYSGITEISWYAEDDFGNMDTCTYNIVVIDATFPVPTSPKDTIVMCAEMAQAIDTFTTLADLMAAGGSFTDNCGIDSFGIVSEIEIGDDTIRRTYIAIDTTGNSTTLTHDIIINDTTPPYFDAPADVTIDCSIALDNIEVLGTVDSTMLDDNCMDTDTLIYTDNIFSTGSCIPNDSIQRIWILTDESGNESRDTQIITKIDTIGPVFDMALLPIADILCGDVLPATQVLTATDHCTGFTITIDTTPSVSPPLLCSDYEIKYIYTAQDNCGNTTLDSVSFFRLGDSTVPVLVDRSNQVLNSSVDTCGVLVSDVPKPIFMDDCSDTIIMTSDFAFDLYPLGTRDVVWTATNACGLSNTVTQTITIEDNVPPVIVCKDLNVSLGGDGIAIVQADTIDTSISDNCAHYFANKISVRRLDNGTACGNDGMFNSSVTFCCEDIGKTIMVEVQVHDGNGNFNSCTSEITINNASLQTNIPVLPDISISCEFTYDPDDLSIFGSYVDDPADQEDIRIEDQYYTVWDSIAGEDVVFINTCGLTSVTESSDFVSGGCGNDTLTRYFKFNNGMDSLTLKQRIIRNDLNPFTENDIEWPATYLWNQCMNPAPDTSISGAPIITNDDFCSQVAVTYKDQLFNFPVTSCPKVLRKWKVIDWCQYNNSNGTANNPGLWTHEQYIIVENDVPPTILSACNDTLICAPGNSCQAIVSLDIAAEDDCGVSADNLLYSYRIDIGNDNIAANDITGNTSSFVHDVEAGIHKVAWAVNDRCGNTNNSCEFLITVKECKDPTPVCHDGLALDLSGLQSVELWASDINQSSNDNCTPQSELLFSFSPDPTDNLKTFTCADQGPNEVDMWITDQAGNQSFCTATVSIQDNLGGCTITVPIIEGKITTENNVAIPEAMVSIIGAEMEDEIMTSDDGQYAFSDLNIQNDYQVKVDRDKNYMDGVTTLDLVKIQRHILGLEELNSPYQLIAADVNNNESISAADLLALRKLILGVNVTLDNNTSWRFISKNTAMNDMTDPWPFTEELNLQMSNNNPIDADFIGVKIGDVNNSAESLLTYENIETRNSTSLGIIINDKVIRRDDQVFIDLINAENIEIEAMQMTISWDAEAMTLIDIVPVGIEMTEYHTAIIAPGQITVAWHNAEGKQVAGGVPFFQLIMEGNQSSRLSQIFEINSELTEAIAYNEKDEPMDIDIRFIDRESKGISFGQNKPNPFLSNTTVEFNLPETMEVTFKVFNSSGKFICKTTSTYSEGINTLKLGDQLGNHKGILFLKMEAAEFSEVKRMIRIE